MKLYKRDGSFYIEFRPGVRMQCEIMTNGRLKVNSAILKFYFENVLTEDECNQFEKYYMDIPE